MTYLAKLSTRQQLNSKDVPMYISSQNMKFTEIDFNLLWFWIKMMPGPVNRMNKIGQKNPSARQMIASWMTAEIKKVNSWGKNRYFLQMGKNLFKSRQIQQQSQSCTTIFHFLQQDPNQIEFHQSEQNARSGNRVISAHKFIQLCKNPKNPIIKKHTDGNINLITVNKNVLKSSFCSKFSILSLHHITQSKKPIVMEIITVISAGQEVDQMGNYFGKRSNWRQCILVSVNQSGYDKKVTKSVHFFEKVSQGDLDFDLFLGFFSKRIKVFVRIISQVQHFRPKITMRFHDHSDCFTQDDKNTCEAQWLMQGLIYANIQKSTLVQDVQWQPNFYTRLDPNEDEDNNGVVNKCKEPPGQKY